MVDVDLSDLTATDAAAAEIGLSDELDLSDFEEETEIDLTLSDSDTDDFENLDLSLDGAPDETDSLLSGEDILPLDDSEADIIEDNPFEEITAGRV